MTTAAMAPPERPVPFLTPPVEPLRRLESADGVVAGEVVPGIWELRPVWYGLVGVTMLVVVASGNDDDVLDGLITAEGTRLEDDRKMVGIPTTGETCTTVVMVGVLEKDTSVGTTGRTGPGAGSSS